MECRLCLGPAPAESSVSIFSSTPDPHPERLEQRIRTCCQIQVKRSDGLPDTVCLSCKTNLELLISFRKACFRSNEKSLLSLDDCLKIKTEEVLLEDVIWDDEPSLSTIHRKNSEICLKPFPNISELVLHKISHTGENLFKCDICLKSFIRKSTLVKHLRTHTGEKPYKCKICLKSFSDKSNLKKHKELHAGIKPHKCDICLKSFVRRSSLVRHLKTHTGEKPYKCEICLKSFSYISNLKQHKNSHAGIKPHKCDICLKSFSQKSYLKVHKKMHAGIKPHKCDICLNHCLKNVASRNIKKCMLG
ncbi:uncharacterized protein LOC143921053 isoform X3 [Arctopsyche grandis]|uniref:uncharacterized protein LOC143921053 isoform X3 n=1 Tax=Arctopsyche grandis TaxID=121162 RepID=UPI00406D98AF